MRNILLLRDSLHPLQGLPDDTSVAAACCDNGGAELLVLTTAGMLRGYDADTFQLLYECDLSLLEDEEEEEEDAGKVPPPARIPAPAADRSWFLLTVLAETGAIACVSRSGKIAAVTLSMCLGRVAVGAEGRRTATGVLEGVIDSGIAVAAWSPDQTRLVLFTGGGTLLSMSSQWDPLDEVPAGMSVCPVCVCYYACMCMVCVFISPFRVERSTKCAIYQPSPLPAHLHLPLPPHSQSRASRALAASCLGEATGSSSRYFRTTNRTNRVGGVQRQKCGCIPRS